MRTSFAILASSVGVHGQAVLTPNRLRVEYMDEPRGVDVPSPRFSWALASDERAQAQTAYRIVVRSEDAGSAVVFDSGQVMSNRSTNAVLALGGSGSSAGQHQFNATAAYTWSVSAWGSDHGAGANEGPASQPARFSTGVQGDWKGAEWIGTAAAGSASQGTLLRTEFAVPIGCTVERATVHSVGLGYYKLQLDGARASDHELGAFTTFASRVYYDTVDVTAALRAPTAGAKHALGVALGAGWYAQKTVHAGQRSLLLRLHAKLSGCATPALDVVSTSAEGVWTTAAGPVTMDDIYAGENYDARLEQPGWDSPGFAPSGGGAWASAAAVAAPSANVTVDSHAVLPPIRVGETYAPCDMWQSSPGVYVFDFCQNMAGFTTLRLPAGLAPGATLTQKHAEAIKCAKPCPIFHHYGNTAETTNYTTGSSFAAAEYTPLFTYMGFRYVELSGGGPGGALPDGFVPSFETLSAHFVHTDYEMTGDVSFSDPNLDAVQHITRFAAMSNFQSIPTDCPQRERRGWLGDAQLSAETNVYNFDMGASYTSFVQQIDDAQDPTTGATQDCVPWYGHGHQPADPAWGSAYTFIADWVQTYFDDDRIFSGHYAGIKAHLESLKAQAALDDDGGLLDFSWWGDWCPPQGCAMDVHHHNMAIVSSFMYLKQLRIMAKMSKRLGHATDQAEYEQLEAQVAAAFNAKFFNKTGATYYEYGRTAKEYLSPQTCISLAMELGVIPADSLEDVMKTLVHDVMVLNNGHLNTGIVGVKYLLPALSRGGHVDVALQVAQTEDQPGWVYMVKQGATTLWETWTGSRYEPKASWNHIMFGANSEWYYKELAGIVTDSTDPVFAGWKKLTLFPKVMTAAGADICGRLSSVEASMVTTRGPISAAWACAPAQLPGLCASVEEQHNATLSCPAGGGTIDSIKYAVYGTPNGTCASDGGFVDWNCTKHVEAIFTAACVGKQSCSVQVSSQTFGGDPCFGIPKHVSVRATGCATAVVPLFTYKVTVPVGSVATVILPLMSATAANVAISEGGMRVYAKGAYVPAVIPGITGAKLQQMYSTGTAQAIAVEVGSGSFSFAVSK